MLGIVIGVTSVILLVAVVSGLNSYITRFQLLSRGLLLSSLIINQTRKRRFLGPQANYPRLISVKLQSGRFFTTTVTWWSVVLSFGFSALVGIVFGVLPAIRAARLNPIQALRYE